MKLSFYAIIVDIPTGKVFYSTMYKNIAELSVDEYKLFTILRNNDFQPTSSEEASLLHFLSDQMFVVEDNMDELAYFKLGWNRSLYSSGIHRHTILPNLSCNLDCPYCFENKTGAFMSRETEKSYLAWLERQIVGAKTLYVQWFGGEPLLSKSTIARLTDGILCLEE